MLANFLLGLPIFSMNRVQLTSGYEMTGVNQEYK
jgi:hypothetical protein